MIKCNFYDVFISQLQLLKNHKIHYILLEIFINRKIITNEYYFLTNS